MHRVSTHIEHLLLVHDCVIIPGFGGFVLQSISGEYNNDEHSFSPMWKEVVFNTALQHNDGLLTESYMQVYAVDYQKARRMLDEDIHELKSVLTHYRKATFGTVGSFSLGTEKQIIFQPNKNESFDINNYGLSTFHFQPLSVVLKEKETQTLPAKIQKEKKEIFYFPVNRRLVRTVVASVAAVSLFLLVSTSVKDVNQSAYTASFIPSKIITSVPTTPTPVASSSEAIITEENENNKGETVVETLTTETVAPKEEVSIKVPQPEIKKQPVYYAIIASFPSEKLARLFIDHVDHNRFHNVNVVYSDKKYRVYANKFVNRHEADSYTEQLWKNSIYRDAWVFAGK